MKHLIDEYEVFLEAGECEQNSESFLNDLLNQIHRDCSIPKGIKISNRYARKIVKSLLVYENINILEQALEKAKQSDFIPDDD